MPLIAPQAVLLSEVARAGSIRGAAAKLNISPSAVNRQILNLEAEYGAELFERLPRGMRLTAAGEVLVNEIRHWLQDQDRARRHLSEMRGMVRGHASIGMMESVARHLVSRLMTLMKERQSPITFDVVVGGTSRIVDDLVAGRLDLAVCFAVPRQSEIEVVATVEPHRGIVVARDHPLATRTSLRLTDCAPYTFALPDASLTSRRTLDIAFERANMTPAHIVTTNSVEVIKMLVREHGHIAVLSRADITFDTDRDALIHIPFADQLIRGSHLSLITRKHARLSPVTAQVAGHLTDLLNAFP